MIIWFAYRTEETVDEGTPCEHIGFYRDPELAKQACQEYHATFGTGGQLLPWEQEDDAPDWYSSPADDPKITYSVDWTEVEGWREAESST